MLQAMALMGYSMELAVFIFSGELLTLNITTSFNIAHTCTCDERLLGGLRLFLCAADLL